MFAHHCLIVGRHALDFRLMKGQRVAILDGSHSLFGVNTTSQQAVPFSVPSSPKKEGQQDADTFKDGLGLRAIPRFREIVLEAVEEVVAFGPITQHGGAAQGRIVPIDVGVVCDTTAVRAIARAVHVRVVETLKLHSGVKNHTV